MEDEVESGTSSNKLGELSGHAQQAQASFSLYEGVTNKFVVGLLRLGQGPRMDVLRDLHSTVLCTQR